jgi:hypothetical protein
MKYLVQLRLADSGRPQAERGRCGLDWLREAVDRAGLGSAGLPSYVWR